uniref:Uncharacterized protein n=1 Tax=Meloidogyne incognita TaxID=6306 RepID=A0A914KVG3_MELIC
MTRKRRFSKIKEEVVDQKPVLTKDPENNMEDELSALESCATEKEVNGEEKVDDLIAERCNFHLYQPLEVQAMAHSKFTKRLCVLRRMEKKRLVLCIEVNKIKFFCCF